MNPKTTPKDFFLWAGAMFALFGSIVAFLALVFDYINYAFPDPLLYYPSDPFQNGAAHEMASFIILGALCLVLLRVIHRTIEKDPTRADIWIRRWALFLTLFVAGATIAVDLIILLTTFLNGEELSVRFLLKVVLVLFVSAVGFMHFLADLRGYWAANPNLSVRVTWGVGILGVLTLVVGFFVLGTPWQARQYRLDGQRVTDLQNIQYQVINYWQLKGKLPNAITDLDDSISYFVIPTDPQTGQDYGYKMVQPNSFKLCATFDAPSRDNGSYLLPQRKTGYDTAMNSNWLHEAGERCFDRTIDADLYPVTPGKTAPVPAI